MVVREGEWDSGMEIMRLHGGGWSNMEIGGRVAREVGSW